MRICIDLDGTICELRKELETSTDVKINYGAAEEIRQFSRTCYYNKHRKEYGI